MTTTTRRTEFIERDGEIHFVAPDIGGEFTLCGDAFDADLSEGDVGSWNKTRSKIVTCHDCARVILACRGVRVSKEAKEANQ